MKILKPFILALLASATLMCFAKNNKPLNKQVDEALEFSLKQSIAMAKVMDTLPGRLPKTIKPNGEFETSDQRWWTSGFFPGQLWYMYEYSGDENIKNLAHQYSLRVANQQYTTDNHDVGFMIFCSFGNGYRLTKNEDYLSVIENASKSLCTRFNPITGCTRSWDRGAWNKRWQYAVIIDNMMNLELLMWAAQEFKNPEFEKVALSHANTTMKNHFRPDGSSYHVISYDTITGEPHAKNTAQGYSDSSAWARGQAWGLYGYSMMYRMTGKKEYLEKAKTIANFIINHPNLPEDKIPYWDFNAPDIPNAKRDVSAGAITCSALLELSGFVDKKLSNQYLDVAKKQLSAMCNKPYLANLGENGNFILKHSVGHLPNKSEVDVPLTYADYYFVEALIRYKNLKKK